MILRYFQPFPTIDLLQFTLLLQSAPTLQLRRAPYFTEREVTFLTIHPVCYKSKTLVGCFLTAKNHFSCGSAISTHLLFYKVSAVIYLVQLLPH